tara:strand:+ start:47 stop:223 length:177 start_codon:yes stop_codon:yes gene_type:complete
LLDVNGRMRKVDATPTIQYRVDDQIVKSFSALEGYYKCSNAELIRALIKDYLKKHKDV